MYPGLRRDKNTKRKQIRVIWNDHMVGEFSMRTKGDLWYIAFSTPL
jgi:hypothetical protein